MSGDTLFAMMGLMSLVAAVLTGALWDSPLVAASLQVGRNFRAEGRHAMRR